MNQKSDKFFFIEIKKRCSKNTCFAVPGGSKWDGRPMAHADFKGTPTYFAVSKLMISDKNMN